MCSGHEVAHRLPWRCLGGAVATAAALIACNAILSNDDRTIGDEENPSSLDASRDGNDNNNNNGDATSANDGSSSGSTDSNVLTDGGGGSDAADADAAPRVFVGCLGNPACERVIFATSFAFTGDLGGTAGADAKCQTAADQSALVRLKDHQFVAWLSTSAQDAKNRVVQGSQQYVRANGTVVIASNFNELVTTGPKGPIHDETDTKTTKGAWTGTENNGNRSPATCSDWASGSATVKGLTGNPDLSQAGTWSADPPNTDCNQSAILICIER